MKGYEKEAQSEDMKQLLPAGVTDKFSVIFGNLDELYNFHSEIFLKDLENCIMSTDLVALCFVQKVSLFLQLNVLDNSLKCPFIERELFPSVQFLLSEHFPIRAIARKLPRTQHILPSMSTKIRP